MSRFKLFSLGLMALSLAVLRLTPLASAGKSTVPTLLLGNIHRVNGQAMEGVAVSARPVGGKPSPLERTAFNTEYSKKLQLYLDYI